MIAGRLTERVKLLRPASTTDRFGSNTISYVEVATVHAEVKWKSGSTAGEASELFSGDRIEILIRSAHTVEPKWRAEYMGVIYFVEAIEHNRLKGMKRLLCNKVNE